MPKGKNRKNKTASVEETFLARVVEGYRITIPELWRKRLGINKGDTVEVTIKKVDST